MFNAIKKIKATKQHLWFLSKQNLNENVELLSDSFFQKFNKAYIIAPHMDDEVYGSFQLICTLIQQKKQVEIIYCISKTKNKDCKRRINESKSVFKTIKKHYLGINDSKASEEKQKLKTELLQILDSNNSLYVFPEFANSNHKDHNAVNAVMNEICKEQNQSNILKTELIVPIERTNYLKIEDFNKKTKAFSKYHSQKNHVNYKKIENYLETSGNKTEYREFYAK